jgi:hypothetical protein
MPELSDQESNLLKQIVKNKPQFEALKKFLIAPLLPDNWLRTLNFNMSNEEYGERAKVLMGAKNQFQNRFEEMEALIEEKKAKEPKNEAR